MSTANGAVAELADDRTEAEAGKCGSELGYVPIRTLPTASVHPSPENNQLYAPIDKDSGEFKALVASVSERGVTGPWKVDSDEERADIDAFFADGVMRGVISKHRYNPCPCCRCTLLYDIPTADHGALFVDWFVCSVCHFTWTSWGERMYRFYSKNERLRWFVDRKTGERGVLPDDYRWNVDPTWIGFALLVMNEREDNGEPVPNRNARKARPVENDAEPEPVAYDFDEMARADMEHWFDERDYCVHKVTTIYVAQGCPFCGCQSHIDRLRALPRRQVAGLRCVACDQMWYASNNVLCGDGIETYGSYTFTGEDGRPQIVRVSDGSRRIGQASDGVQVARDIGHSLYVWDEMECGKTEPVTTPEDEEERRRLAAKRGLLTLGGARTYTGRTQGELLRAIGDGELKAVKRMHPGCERWRFEKVALDEWMANRVVKCSDSGAADASLPLRGGVGQRAAAPFLALSNSARLTTNGRSEMKKSWCQREREVRKRLRLKTEECNRAVMLLMLACGKGCMFEMPAHRLLLPPWKQFSPRVVTYLRQARGYDVVRDAGLDWPHIVLGGQKVRWVSPDFQAAADGNEAQPADNFLPNPQNPLRART